MIWKKFEHHFSLILIELHEDSFLNQFRVIIFRGKFEIFFWFHMHPSSSSWSAIRIFASLDSGSRIRKKKRTFFDGVFFA